MELEKPKVVLFVGPTAVGKTIISIELAKIFSGEIISADSRLFYRGMDIGTAKPSLLERKGVVHHLIDIIDPDQTFSLANFQSEVHKLVDEIHQRGNLPLLVGGTGQYINSIINQWSLPQVEPDYELRRYLQDWSDQIGYSGLHQRLRILDQQAAEFIDPRNLRRTIRAIEVVLKSGKKFSSHRKKGPAKFQFLKIGLNRPRVELYARIDERIGSMIDQGFIDEVSELINKGYEKDLPSFSAIGYRQIAAYLEGQLTLDEAITQMKRATRKFVRRQANWFKSSDESIHWFNIVPAVSDEIEKEIIIFINNHHNSHLV